jgi:hypothetical protein
MSKGPFIKADLAGWGYCTLVDGHLSIPRAGGPESAHPFPGLARAAEALRVIGCGPEAELLESSGTGYLSQELAEALVRGLKRITRKKRGPWIAALAACRALRREIVEANTPPPWDIRRKGRQWSEDEFYLRWESLGECKTEVVGGKLFNDHRERMAVLAMILEGVGIDAALRLGDLALWKEAVDAAIRAKRARAAAAGKRGKLSTGSRTGAGRDPQ